MLNLPLNIDFSGKVAVVTGAGGVLCSDFAKAIVKKLGLPLGDSEVGKFSDGEISVNIYETVRGSDVFVIQSTCNPVNDNLMELLIMIDACRRASAGRINYMIASRYMHSICVKQFIDK